MAVPPRRAQIVVERLWQGHMVRVGVGVDPATGAVFEAFADMQHSGQLACAVSDAAVLVSLCLQHGVDPQAVGKSLGRVPLHDWRGWIAAPASPAGLVADIVAEVARDPVGVVRGVG